MRYAGRKLRQMLAAEYVLGTLRGRARARFVRLLAGDAVLRLEVAYWEQRLAGLASRIAPVTPREVVWTAIDRSINANAVAGQPQRGAGGLAFWRGWAAVSTADSRFWPARKRTAVSMMATRSAMKGIATSPNSTAVAAFSSRPNCRSRRWVRRHRGQGPMVLEEVMTDWADVSATDFPSFLRRS